MMIILSKWNKIYVFSIVQHSKIPEIHSILSFLEMEMTSGFHCRDVLCCHQYGVSVIPFTNFAIVLPVHGAMTSAQKGLLALIGSAS